MNALLKNLIVFIQVLFWGGAKQEVDWGFILMLLCYTFIRRIGNRWGYSGLVVMGGDSCSEGSGFEFQHRIPDGHCTVNFLLKFVRKRPKLTKKSPFFNSWGTDLLVNPVYQAWLRACLRSILRWGRLVHEGRRRHLSHRREPQVHVGPLQHVRAYLVRMQVPPIREGKILRLNYKGYRVAAIAQ